MKIKIFLIGCLFILLSCGNESVVVNTTLTKNMVVVDTFAISRNGFNQVLGYNLIVKMDSSYYSVWSDKKGNVTTIHRKLNCKYNN